MNQLSEYIKKKDFTYKIVDSYLSSRLKRCITIIEELPVGLFLDIGCSDGGWAKYWQDRDWQVFGVDINFGSVKTAKRKGLSVEVVDLNEGNLPFVSNYFDLIYAGEVIEHLIDTDGFLQEVHRCLKPEGHLLLTTPNLTSLENRIRILFGRYPMWVDYGLHGSGHVRAYTPRILKFQISQNGFKVVKHTGNRVPFLPQKIVDDVKLPWFHFTGLLSPNLAMDIILLARKTL